MCASYIKDMCKIFAGAGFRYLPLFFCVWFNSNCLCKNLLQQKSKNNLQGNKINVNL